MGIFPCLLDWPVMLLLIMKKNFARHNTHHINDLLKCDTKSEIQCFSFILYRSFHGIIVCH